MDYDSGTPATGAIYKVSVSAGLNMSNDNQWPLPEFGDSGPGQWSNNHLLWGSALKSGTIPPLWYAPRLIAGVLGVAQTINNPPIHAIGYMTPQPYFYDTNLSSVIVHDSRPRELLTNGNLEMIDHAGIAFHSLPNGTGAGLSFLTCYPDPAPNGVGWPQGYDIYPVTVEPVQELNSTEPNDGSSSTEFVFRVRYNNADNLPPLSWMHYWNDPWLFNGGEVETKADESGVILYLDESGTGDYHPHFMQPEVTTQTGAGNVYVYRVIPHSAIGIFNAPPPYPLGDLYDGGYGVYNFDNTLYQSLSIGVYHYFFGCSDDSIVLDDAKTYLFDWQPNETEWGYTSIQDNSDWLNHESTGTDPSVIRQVAGYSAINRAPQRVPSCVGDPNVTGPYDSTIYVDRPDRVPGLFEQTLQTNLGTTYPWKASQHPEITCSLGMYQVQSRH